MEGHYCGIETDSRTCHCPLIMAIGNLVNIGFMAEFNVVTTIVYGLVTGFMANGLYALRMSASNHTDGFCLSILLSSCVTQACLRKFPSSTDTVKIVIIKDSIVFRDTTLFITLPEVVSMTRLLFRVLHRLQATFPIQPAETDFAKAQAWYDYR